MDILLKLIKGEVITNDDIAVELYEICEREHATCNCDCPVYALNEGKIPHSGNGARGCDCFKDGVAMLDFIEKKLNLK